MANVFCRRGRSPKTRLEQVIHPATPQVFLVTAEISFSRNSPHGLSRVAPVQHRGAAGQPNVVAQVESGELVLAWRHVASAFAAMQLAAACRLAAARLVA